MQLLRTMRYVLASSVMAVCGCVPGGSETDTLDCNSLFTSFEFTDTDGAFSLAHDGFTVSFSGGLAQRVGNLSLYRTGLFAWMIPAGETGTIRFDPPTAEVNLYVKDQFDSTGSKLEIIDSTDTLIASFDGATSYLNVNISIDTTEQNPIASITLRNNGTSGFAVIEDLSACIPEGGGDDAPVDDPLSDPIPEPITAGEVVARLETLTTGLVAPNWGISAPGDPDRLFVVDQTGQLWAINIDTGERTLFLDLSDRLVELGAFGPESFDERGFLGVAFHPDYPTNGLFYTYTSEPGGSTPDFSTMPQGVEPNHQSVIAEWRVEEPTEGAAVANSDSARELLRIDQPQFNHNAGALNFGPDGYLYIAIGDGGGADDGQPMVGHSPQGNGQDVTNPLGAVLRIDATGTNSMNGHYGIPDDNPFAGDRVPGAVPEIFAFGLRNPFRFSFDTGTQALYLADVGQNDIEEINIIENGGNYGWRLREGLFPFDPNGEDAGFVTAQPPMDTSDLINPVAQYDHDEGVAIVGGFVYRGTEIAGLIGRYVFGDFSHPSGGGGRLFYLDQAGQVVELQLENDGGLGLSLLGFGQDAAGELYVLANATSTPFGETGVVMRIRGTSE